MDRRALPDGRSVCRVSVAAPCRSTCFSTRFAGLPPWPQPSIPTAINTAGHPQTRRCEALFFSDRRIINDSGETAPSTISTRSGASKFQSYPELLSLSRNRSASCSVCTLSGARASRRGGSRPTTGVIRAFDSVIASDAIRRKSSSRSKTFSQDVQAADPQTVQQTRPAIPGKFRRSTAAREVCLQQSSPRNSGVSAGSNLLGTKQDGKP